MRLIDKIIVKSLQAYWRQSRGLALGVQAIVHDDGGRVLLVRQSANTAWGLPTASVLSNEAAPKAVVRMLANLAGIEAGPPTAPILIVHGAEVAPNQHLAIYSLAIGAGGAQSTPIDRATVGFFERSSLPPNLPPDERQRLDMIFADATR